MNVPLKILLLLWIFTATALPISFASGQTLTTVTPAPKIKSNPATDADFYLDKAAAKVAAIQTFVESIQDITDIRKYPFRPVLFSKRDTNQATQTLMLAKAQIDLLPDHVKTDRLYRHRKLSRQTSRLDHFLTTIRTSLQASLNPKAFPDLKADAARFRGFGMMLANVDVFESDPDLAAAIVAQLPDAQQEVSRIVSKYDLLIQQETIAGLQLAGLQRYFVSKQRSFQAIIKQQQQTLPEQIKGDRARVQKTLLSQNQKQAELPSQLRKIEAELKLLEAINPQPSELLLTYRKQLSDLRVAVQNIKPADRYVGDDRDDLLKAVFPSGAKPNSSSIRIPTKTWRRQTYLRLSSGRWRTIDRSVLEVFVQAKNADASLSWQRFLLIKDHLNKDSLSIQRGD
ncbi:hypothetical protein N9Y42_01615 [Mariniblastus sp.]|nr:hypothetical protein [Mariniblastus sp.]